MKVCKLKSNCKITCEYIVNALGSSDKFVERELASHIISFISGDCKITVYTSEFYYNRISSTLTITLVIEETKEDTVVNLISSGGKARMALTSLGAESSALNIVLSTLKKIGFVIIKN